MKSNKFSKIEDKIVDKKNRKLKWDSLKEASLREQPLYTCFEYRFGHKAIHATVQGLNLESIELVRGQAADEWLWVICWCVLRKELPYIHR